jgi:alanine racemase
MNAELVCAEIDLNAIANNVKELRRITDPNARLMAVVKANGYGHGATEVARCALQNGAEALGVARIEEAIQIRAAGIQAPILIFGYTSPEIAPKVLTFDLTQTVYSFAYAKALSDKASYLKKKIRVHLKIDTGMGRLGLLAGILQPNGLSCSAERDPVQEALSIAALAGLEVEGIFTHFATADSADKSYAKRQLDLFGDYLERLRQAGLDFPIKHAANSAALIDFPESHLDMVRPGIATYGLYPSEEVNKARVALEPAMTLKAQIIHLKKVPAGFKVSYGITYQTKKSTIIATVPIGYADGLNRLLSSRGQMLIRGQRAPIIGRVCMDLTMLDVGHINNVSIGDEVVVFGQQGDETLTVDDMASALNTINYEIVSTLTDRVPRIYTK